MTAEVNPIVTAYLSDNEDWISENSAAAISHLTDAEWPAIIAAMLELRGSAEPGIGCKVTITQETMDDFDGARATNWTDRGTRRAIDCAGTPGVLFERIQLHRGQPRRTVAVIDLGRVRVALH